MAYITAYISHVIPLKLRFFLVLLATARATQLLGRLRTNSNDYPDGTGIPDDIVNPDRTGNPDGTAPLSLLDLDKYPLARCLDGSPGGYYYSRAARRKTNSWIVHLQGGGECASKRCNTLKQTALGTSTRFPKRHSFRGDSVDRRTGSELGDIGDFMTVNNYQVMIDNNRYENPDFFDWNMVFVPYCSQDLWTGRRTERNAETLGVYFSGAYILGAVMNTLDTKHGMQNATEIIFSGDSAGGYGVLHHLDAVASAHPLAKTVGMPVGALWNYAFPYAGFSHTSAIFEDFREPNWLDMRNLWQTKANADCESLHNGDSTACLVGCSSAPYLWTFIKSRVFIVEAQTDEVLLIMHSWVPPPPLGFDGKTDPKRYTPRLQNYVQEFGQNMTQCLKTGLNQLSSLGMDHVGIFSPACFIHTAFKNDLQIEGKTLKQAFSDFYYERGPTPKLVEEGFLTNPTCKAQFLNMMS